VILFNLLTEVNILALFLVHFTEMEKLVPGLGVVAVPVAQHPLPLMTIIVFLFTVWHTVSDFEAMIDGHRRTDGRVDGWMDRLTRSKMTMRTEQCTARAPVVIERKIGPPGNGSSLKAKRRPLGDGSNS
jgi:hypothetical protein